MDRVGLGRQAPVGFVQDEAGCDPERRREPLTPKTSTRWAAWPARG